MSEVPKNHHEYDLMLKNAKLQDLQKLLECAENGVMPPYSAKHTFFFSAMVFGCVAVLATANIDNNMMALVMTGATSLAALLSYRTSDSRSAIDRLKEQLAQYEPLCEEYYQKMMSFQNQAQRPELAHVMIWLSEERRMLESRLNRK